MTASCRSNSWISRCVLAMAQRSFMALSSPSLTFWDVTGLFRKMRMLLSSRLVSCRLLFEDAGVAGVVAALEDRDGALVEVHAGGVLELDAQERELGLGALVVDADARGLDVLGDDGQHGGLLAGQGHRPVDGILEEVA